MFEWYMASEVCIIKWNDSSSAQWVDLIIINGSSFILAACKSENKWSVSYFGSLKGKSAKGAFNYTDWKASSCISITSDCNDGLKGHGNNLSWQHWFINLKLVKDPV